ncbi:MAG: hypothetical protein C4347_01395 [Patescibacteria group bacterium]
MLKERYPQERESRPGEPHPEDPKKAALLLEVWLKNILRGVEKYGVGILNSSLGKLQKEAWKILKKHGDKLTKNEILDKYFTTGQIPEGEAQKLAEELKKIAEELKALSKKLESGRFKE